MASHKSPLRDRLLSNSPDPIKASILRDSGSGWNSPPTGSVSSVTSNGSITSPLRIAKRDSPGRPRGADVARRTSSSFRHVRNNNLVSKSPFKSQLPTPSTPSRTPLIFPTRRVSGEKRPRPSSMHDSSEAENDRPFALKRERKQSKGFQGLIEKEPVTKSPFRIQQHMPAEEHHPPVPRPISMPNVLVPSFDAPHVSYIPATTTAADTRPSPGRSSLVSRRMHGPRLSGGPRRERRKTVTFDERCDVVEFDREESEDEIAMESDEDHYGLPEPEHSHEMDDDDPFFRGQPGNTQQESEEADVHGNEEHMEEEASYESIQLSDPEPSPVVPSLFDPDSSITGLVDQMFSSAGANNAIESLSVTSTPPRHSDIPTDLETEDGVPVGRSHHVERFLQHHQQHTIISSPHQPSIQPPHFSPHVSPRNSPLIHNSPHQQGSPVQGFPFNTTSSARSSPRSLPATPPNRQSSVPNSTPPLGRSTHIERILKAREEEKAGTGVGDEDFEKLPGSPSPMKKPLTTGRISLEESLVPRFELPEAIPSTCESTTNNDASDPFDYPADRDYRDGNISIGKGDESMDPANLSIGNSEVSLSGLLRENRDVNDRAAAVDTETETASTTMHDFLPADGRPSLPTSHSTESLSFPARIGSPLGGSPRFGSPRARAMSPISHSSPTLIASSGSSQSPQTGRQRITREDVKRRLLHRRSFGSPGPDGEEPTFSSPTHRSPAPSPATSEVDQRMQEGAAIKSPETQYHPSGDKEKDRMSIMTGMTDFSTETAIIQSAQKVSLDLSIGSLIEAENIRLGSKDGLHDDFGNNDCAEISSTSSRDSLGIISRPDEIKVGSVNSNGTGSVKMGDVDVNMDMKSALDRLMDDVAGAGAGGCADDSMMTDDYEESYDNQSNEFLPHPLKHSSEGLNLPEHSTFDSRDISASSATSTAPPPLPPKDNIKSREQLILEKRREARRMEEEIISPVSSPRGKAQEFRNLGVGRPSRRRSLSTGDAETMSGRAKKRGDALLDVKEVMEDDPLADSIEKELKKLVETPRPKSKYQVREREGTIYASSSEEWISHSAGAGDLNAGKAWRPVRRPSDMNEYSKQIKEYRSQQNPGKAYGKVFVRVIGVKGIHLPLPLQPTVMTCTLNNGIHFVTTPECQLAPDCRIDQEFELIEHSKLEFTLTLKIRRDPHIITQYKALSPAPAPPPPPPVVVQPPSRSGMRSFFSSSPKKSSKEKIAMQPPPPPPPPQRLPENLARYLKPDGTLARAFISFKDVAARCDTRLFETSYPLIGQRVEIGGKFSTLQAGELVLQIFRLPPLPGIPPEELPQSLEECVRGLRHLNWHKVTYFQGTLTQIGGDCSTWRRRQLRVIGSNLVAFNDVTKKATTTIDLKKAVAVEDDQEGGQGRRGSRYADDYDGLYGVERSFRLIFPQDQEIVFFADTDDEKARWLDILRALVGHIPPYPLWGELLWQRQEELLRRGQSGQQGAQSPS